MGVRIVERFADGGVEWGLRDTPKLQPLIGWNGNFHHRIQSLSKCLALFVESILWQGLFYSSIPVLRLQKDQMYKSSTRKWHVEYRHYDSRSPTSRDDVRIRLYWKVYRD